MEKESDAGGIKESGGFWWKLVALFRKYLRWKKKDTAEEANRNDFERVLSIIERFKKDREFSTAINAINELITKLRTSEDYYFQSI